MKVVQFRWNIFQFGGGERVMLALKKAFKAEIYCATKERKLDVSRKVKEIKGNFPVKTVVGPSSKA